MELFQFGTKVFGISRTFLFITKRIVTGRKEKENNKNIKKNERSCGRVGGGTFKCKLLVPGRHTFAISYDICIHK